MTVEEFNEKLSSLRKGNNKAWKDIYEEYYAFIYFTALSYVKNESFAEDIASDVMIFLCINSSSQGYIKNPKSYLYKITLNKIRNTTRLKSMKNVELDFDEPDPKSNDNFSTVEVKQLLNSLPSIERKIFVAHVFWGVSFKVIAKQTGISIMTVRRKYLNACNHLKDVLDDIQR